MLIYIFNLKLLQNDSYLFNLRPNIYKYWRLNSYFIPDNSYLIGW